MESEKIIDITGTELTPGNGGKNCLGNGTHPGIEICCDGCDFFLRCYEIGCMNCCLNCTGVGCGDRVRLD